MSEFLPEHLQDIGGTYSNDGTIYNFDLLMTRILMNVILLMLVVHIFCDCTTLYEGWHIVFKDEFCWTKSIKVGRLNEDREPAYIINRDTRNVLSKMSFLSIRKQFRRNF